MNNHRMCKMVFDTLSKSSIDRATLTKADSVTFEYYLGRYELHHLNFRKARELLLRCFDRCYPQAFKEKRYSAQLDLLSYRLILIFLVAASLPIGIFPSAQLLQRYSLDHIFGPIIQSVQEGNFELLSAALYGEHRGWLRYMGLWLLFQERLETLCWRVFIRKLFLILYLFYI